jgi:hypothetical protein
MSCTSPRLSPLNLVLDTRVHPERRETHSISIKLSREELSALLDFTYAIKRRTGNTVSKGVVGRTALQSFLNRHRAWTDGLPQATG